MGEQCGDGVPLPAFGVVDRLEEVVAACASKTCPRPRRRAGRSSPGALAGDAVGAGALRGEARGGAIGEISDRSGHPRMRSRVSCRTGAALSKARDTVICEKPLSRATSSMVGIARERQVGPGVGKGLSVLAILDVVRRSQPGFVQSHRGTQSGSLMRRDWGD